MRHNIEVCRVGARFAFTVDGQVVLPHYATYDEAQAAALDEARMIDEQIRCSEGAALRA